MKRKLLLIFSAFFIFICGCKVILNPVQDERESNKYLHLSSGQIIVQQIPYIKYDLSAVILLISGKCNNLKLIIAEDADFKHIVETKEVKEFSGNIRKTSIFKFKNTQKIRGDLWLKIYHSNGKLLVAYKKGYANFKYNNTLKKDNANMNGALYFKTIYNISLFKIMYSIFQKLFYNVSFIIIYLIILIFLLMVIFSKGLNRFFVKKIIPHLLPADIKYTRDAGVFLKIFILGILIRFLIIPFFCHVDFISGIWVAYMMWYKNIFYYITDPSASFHVLNQVVHLPIVMFSKYIFPRLYQLWNIIPYDYTIKGWYNFAALKSIFKILFVLKIPFLIADVLCLLVLIRFFKTSAVKIRAAAFWMFNPISIYVMYMIGRFEAYAIFFIFLGLLMFKKQKIKSGMLYIGIAAALRQYPLLFIPFILPIISDNYKKVIKYLLIGILPLIIFNLLHNLPGYFSDVTILSPTKVISHDEHSNMLFHYQIKNLVLFPFFYMLGWLFITKNRKLGLKNIWKAIFLFFIIFFGTSNFEPQYFMWIIPFFTIAYAKRFIKWYELLIYLLLFFGVVLQWDKSFSVHLFMPVFEDLFLYLPSPERIINQFYPAAILNQIIQSFFLAINLWIGFRLIKKIDYEE